MVDLEAETAVSEEGSVATAAVVLVVEEAAEEGAWEVVSLFSWFFIRFFCTIEVRFSHKKENLSCTISQLLCVNSVSVHSIIVSIFL